MMRCRGPALGVGEQLLRSFDAFGCTCCDDCLLIAFFSLASLQGTCPGRGTVTYYMLTRLPALLALHGCLRRMTTQLLTMFARCFGRFGCALELGVCFTGLVRPFRQVGKAR